MTFGPIMRLRVGELQIELAPFSKEDLGAFVEGMSKASINKYLLRRAAPTIEDEYDWYEKIRTNSTALMWGIWLITDEKRTLIGNTAINNMIHIDSGIYEAVTGSMIFQKEYWGKGIATAIHKVRTWYGFQHCGLDRIKSSVIQGNVGSLTALKRSGYELVYVERNTVFVDGRMHHQDNLECLNPNHISWKKWWGSDTPTDIATAARKRTRAAMKWAEENATLL